MERKLCKSPTDRMLTGVCGGIGEYFGWDPTWVRIGWAACVLIGGTGLLLYIAAALIMPESPDYMGK